MHVQMANSFTLPLHITPLTLRDAYNGETGWRNTLHALQKYSRCGPIKKVLHIISLYEKITSNSKLRFTVAVLLTITTGFLHPSAKTIFTKSEMFPFLHRKVVRLMPLNWFTSMVMGIGVSVIRSTV